MAGRGAKFNSHRFQPGAGSIPAEVLQDMIEVCRQVAGMAVAAPLELYDTSAGIGLRINPGALGGAGGVTVKIVSGGPGKTYVVDVYPGRYDDAGVELTTAARLAENAVGIVGNDIAVTETIPAGQWYGGAKKVGAHYEFDADIWESS